MSGPIIEGTYLNFQVDKDGNSLSYDDVQVPTHILDRDLQAILFKEAGFSIYAHIGYRGKKLYAMRRKNTDGKGVRIAHIQILGKPK